MNIPYDQIKDKDKLIRIAPLYVTCVHLTITKEDLSNC